MDLVTNVVSGALPIACCCSCTATAPTSAISVACSATSTPRATSPRCCPRVRWPRRPGSPGTTWREDPGVPSFADASTALDDLLDAACGSTGSTGRRRSSAGSRQGGGLALALGSGRSERATAGRACSR